MTVHLGMGSPSEVCWSVCMERMTVTKPRKSKIHKGKIVTADCAASSLGSGGRHCEAATLSFAETNNIEWQPGRRTNKRITNTKEIVGRMSAGKGGTISKMLKRVTVHTRSYGCSNLGGICPYVGEQHLKYVLSHLKKKGRVKETWCEGKGVSNFFVG